MRLPNARRRRRLAGFTLIELLIVIIIIGILLAIGIPAYLQYQSKAKDQAARADLMTAYKALAATKTDNNGSFPAQTSMLAAARQDEPQMSLLSGVSNLQVKQAKINVNLTGTTLTLATLSKSGKIITLSVATNGSTQPVFGTQSAPTGISLSFAAPVTYSTGGNGNQAQMQMADLNGDGKQDIVVGVTGTAGTGYGSDVMLNSGTGTFPAHVQYSSSGNNGGYLALGDWNGDGVKDIVMPWANSSGTSMASYQGASNGTFPTYSGMIAGTWLGGWLDAGDLNADGRAEVVITGTSKIESYNGTSWSETALAAGGGSLAMKIADVNGDGKPDIVGVVAGNSGNSYASQVQVWLNQGSLTFSGPTTYSVGVQTSVERGIAVGDMNNDGKPDVAVSYVDTNGTGGLLTSQGHVAVLLNNGSGGFGAASNATACSGFTDPRGVDIGDFNQDGKPDVSVACYSGGAISVAKGNGDGTLQTATNLTWAGATANETLARDVNGDGKTDILALNSISTVGVFLNNGS